jgi:hypothetical protein
MRIKPGDIVVCKQAAYTLMWCPEMVGQIAIVHKVDYGPNPSGENDLFWIHTPEKLPGWNDWVNHAWTPTLWEKVET